IAVRFALMSPGVSGVLVGFSQLEHIDEAVAAVDMGPLSDNAMRALDAFYASDVS
ncbi:MAG: aldo/keto reductase, partial [Chloroflexi bacterium]|nr:aldo/keto reductase [Chloroflexota bacterium]